MKLKYLSVFLLSSLILPVFAYAQDYTIISDGSSYTPTTFSTDGGTVSLKSYVCVPGNDCNIYIKSGSSAFCRVDYESGISDIDTNTCDNKVINPGTYEIFHMSSMDYFDSITFSIVGEDSGAGSVDPENPKIPLDVVGSFKTTLQGLVSDLVVGFYNYFPLVIVIGIGVLMIFTLWGYIRHASSEIFTLNKNSKKSLSWFQNEDIVNMYKNWKSDRVSKYDINNIVKDTVLPDDPGYYDKDGIRYYTDGDLYTRDLREYETKIYQQGYQELSKNSIEFNHMSSEDQMITLGKYKIEYMDKWRSTHDLDPKKFNV